MQCAERSGYETCAMAATRKFNSCASRSCAQGTPHNWREVFGIETEEAYTSTLRSTISFN